MRVPVEPQARGVRGRPDQPAARSSQDGAIQPRHAGRFVADSPVIVFVPLMLSLMRHVCSFLLWVVVEKNGTRDTNKSKIMREVYTRGWKYPSFRQ